MFKVVVRCSGSSAQKELEKSEQAERLQTEDSLHDAPHVLSHYGFRLAVFNLHVSTHDFCSARLPIQLFLVGTMGARGGRLRWLVHLDETIQPRPRGMSGVRVTGPGSVHHDIPNLPRSRTDQTMWFKTILLRDGEG